MLANREPRSGLSASVVIAGLDPAIHSVTLVLINDRYVMPWSSHGMTTFMDPCMP